MNKDILRYICFKLPPEDLLKCNFLLDNSFWIKKLRKDFCVIYEYTLKECNPKEMYQRMYYYVKYYNGEEF